MSNEPNHTCEKVEQLTKLEANHNNMVNILNEFKYEQRELKKETKDGFIKLESKIDDFIETAGKVYVTKEGLRTIETEQENTDKRVLKIEENINKLVWIIIGFVITSALVIVFKI